MIDFSDLDDVDPEVWVVMFKEVRALLVEHALRQQVSQDAKPITVEFRELSGGSAKCYYCRSHLPENLLVYGRPLGMTSLAPYFACVECVQHLVFEELIMPDNRWQLYLPRERGKRRKRAATGRVKTTIKVPSKKAFRAWRNR